MKEFSPAGVAVKAYYGKGAKTFGNPDGALKGGGAWKAGGNNPNGPNQGGGGSPPPPLPTWTNRGDISGGEEIVAIAMAPSSGITLAVDAIGFVYESTDGGVTWGASIGLIGAGNGQPLGQLCTNDGGTWVFGGTGDEVAKSTNNGVTWTSSATGITLGNDGFIANNPANDYVVWVDVAAPGNTVYALSVNSAVTWTGENGGARHAAGPVIWDGNTTRFALATKQNSGTQYEITTINVTGPAVSATSVSSHIGLLATDGTHYLAGVIDSPNIRQASTLAGLVTASDITATGLVGGLTGVLVGGGVYWAFDSHGGVSGSFDGTSWSVGGLNMTTGEFVQSSGALAYNSFYGNWIAGGSAGSICTASKGQDLAGVITLNAVAMSGSQNGFADGVFGNNHSLNGGSVSPTAVSGFNIGWLYAQNNAVFVLGLYGTHTINDFTQIQYVDQFGTTRTFQASAASFTPVVGGPLGSSWEWSISGQGQPFANGHSYTVTIT